MDQKNVYGSAYAPIKQEVNMIAFDGGSLIDLQKYRYNDEYIEVNRSIINILTIPFNDILSER